MVKRGVCKTCGKPCSTAARECRVCFRLTMKAYSEKLAIIWKDK